MPAEQARAELAPRYLSRYGPATAADIRWWTGWTVAQVRAALGWLRPAPREVTLDGGSTGYVLADDAEADDPPTPWAALLPALDATVMGWADRSWFLGPHAPSLFDRSGNAGPTVWWDGRVVGGWGQRADGSVVSRLLEPVGRPAERAIEAEVERLGAILNGIRVTPRFRTPLERELSAERRA